MKVTTNLKGQLALAKAEIRALELGFIPSKPMFDTRYNLILDGKNELKRIQVKYANGKPTNTNGSVVVKLSYQNRKNDVYTYQKEEVDGLIVYIPKIDKLCFLPPKLFINKRNICIRIKKTRNNQKKGIIFADDYIW